MWQTAPAVEVKRTILTHAAKNGSEKTHRSLLRRAVGKLIALAREKDPPVRIALGMALGIFVGLLPIMGIQMAVVSLFALPLRGNLKAAIAGVWISNPITFIPMYYGCYKFGLLFVSTPEISWETFGGAMMNASEWSWSEISASMGRLMALGGDILVPLWTGSSILAVLFGVPTFFVTYRMVIKYRSKRAARRSA
jgi:hypothetical protein